MSTSGTQMPAELLFARYVPRNLEPKNSLGAKWLRLLDSLELAEAVEGKRTAVKMHLGSDTGFGTIHPFLVRRLVQKLKDAGSKEVFVTDAAEAVRNAPERGYTAETLGCPLVPVSGDSDRYYYSRALEPPFLSFDEVQVAGEIADAEALVDLSHLKGHGNCGFGGASKNLAMGAVTERTRSKIHALEGGLDWNAERCDHCNICLENCPNGVISFDPDGRFCVFYHNCSFCRHCVLICPNHAITMAGGKFNDFQKGLALATARVLETFQPGRVVYINVLLNISIFCDCWGMTSPAVVPDVGILAGRDIVAIEMASLDLIKTEHLIPGSLPPTIELGRQGHLFERIHHKDPYAIIGYLEELGLGHKQYRLLEID